MKDITFLGIPYRLGQRHDGVAQGAHHFRTHGYFKKFSAGRSVHDLGDVFLEDVSERTLKQNSKANALISARIEDLSLGKSVLLNMGGDHGMGLGTVHGMLSHHPNLIVIWADAHGDINTVASSRTGNFHGMPVSFLLGLGTQEKDFSWLKFRLPTKNLIILGGRSLDEAEKVIIQENHIKHEQSLSVEKLQAMLRDIDPSSKCPIHLSLDIDLFDDADVVATGCLVKEGPRKEDVFAVGRFLRETGRLVSVDVVELNPDLGNEHEVERTFSVATEFLDNCL